MESRSPMRSTVPSVPATNRAMQTPVKTATIPAFDRTSRRPRILAADDQQHILDALELLLRPQGYDVETVRSPVLVRESLLTGAYDAVLIDLNYTRDTT